ncbi:RnfH family protein [Vibrio sp. FNV 38]|nr:RnfH family protein [Vibrio sp. FNV 38]
MKVSVVYASATDQVWLDVDVEPEATILNAISCSGILKVFPEIDLSNQKVGVFGKIRTLDSELAEGERVEVYRAVTRIENSLS